MPTPEFAASLGRLAANHLWQSTGFAAVVVVLALVVRANHARARYWLWLAASVKFLIPFSVLAAIGSSLGRWFVPATPAVRVPVVMQQIVQPFAPVQDTPLPAAASAQVTAGLLPVLLLALWFCGFVAVLLYGWARWRRVAVAVRSATPLTEGRELEALWKMGQAIHLPTAIRLVSSNAKLEPGVFGIFRPILWLPAGIGNRLEDAELEAILAHELCHIRRRDNLLATLHLLVESIFWFHPLVWWLGARLEEERERACDEEVVRMGGEPQIYAESILKVCEFYLASPVACAAGVTGGELKKRIEGIMSNRFTRKLSYGKKLLLASAAILATAGPIVVGLLSSPQGQAQASAPTLSFEVASLKPSPPPRGPAPASCNGGPGSADPGLYICSNANLAFLVEVAFYLKSYQFPSADSLDRTKFEIAAKVPPATTREQLDQMLQNLLIGRFQLRYHWEKKEMEVYDLKVAKGGVSMKPSPPPQDRPETPPPPRAGDKPLDADGFPMVGPLGRHSLVTRGANGRERWASNDTEMATIVAFVAAELGGPATDSTGLKGTYDFTLSWVKDADATVAGPAFLEAVKEQLGLKVGRKKGLVDVFKIDHVEKAPAGN
jgi:uncharacterized protein (TIGR03435 family)